MLFWLRFKQCVKIRVRKLSCRECDKATPFRGTTTKIPRRCVRKNATICYTLCQLSWLNDSRHAILFIRNIFTNEGVHSNAINTFYELWCALCRCRWLRRTGGVTPPSVRRSGLATPRWRACCASIRRRRTPGRRFDRQRSKPRSYSHARRSCLPRDWESPFVINQSCLKW